MYQAMWVTVGVTVGAAIGWLVQLLFLRRQRAPASGVMTAPAAAARSRAEPAAPRPKAFHGVCLKPGLDACDAVLSAINQRYLSSEAPALPLSNCDRPRCTCTYGHHADRRDNEDRRSGWGSFGGFAAPVAGGNRRNQQPDRRSTPVSSRSRPSGRPG